jgi:hypothetical protein
MSLPRAILTAAALAVSAGALSAADPIELKQRWVAGKKYEQTIQKTEATSWTIKGDARDNLLKSTMEISESAPVQPAGVVRSLTVKWDRVVFERPLAPKASARAMAVYDSSKPKESTDFTGLGEFHARIAGKELQFLLGKKDEITVIANHDAFIRQIGSAPLGGVDFSQDFSQESLIRIVRTGALQATPGRPVKPGDRWPFSMEVEMMRPNKIGMNGEYTLKSIGDHEGVQCAEIVIDATAALNANPASDSIMGSGTLAQSGWTLQGGSLKGTIWFDPAQGITRESQMTADLKFKSNDPWRNDMDILDKLDFHTKLTAVEDLK